MNVSAGLVPFNSTLNDDHHHGRRGSWASFGSPGESTCSLYPSALHSQHDDRRRHSFSQHHVYRARSGSTCLLGHGNLRSPTDAKCETGSEKTRIRINVRGKKFETYMSTLEQFPDTLLGSYGGRSRFYDPRNEELCFNRDPNSFDAILFFYQSGGSILARPASVNEDLFEDEVKFFGLFEEADEQTVSVNSIKVEENFTGRFRKTRQKIWNTFERPRESRCGRVVARVSLSVILLSVIAFCLETIPDLKGAFNTGERGSEEDSIFWFYLDTVFVIFFTAEYSVRLFSSPSRLKYVRSFLAVVDFCAITPYYVLHIAKAGKLSKIKSFNVIRSIRLFRVIRLLKLSRHSSGLKLLGRALFMSKERMLSLIVCIIMAVVFFSGLMYYIEGFEEDSLFESIPHAFWWSIVTMSTVGYGDVVPRTPGGKLVGAFCALTGIILLFILPIPSFVTDFSKLYESWLRKRKRERHSEGLRIQVNVTTW